MAEAARPRADLTVATEREVAQGHCSVNAFSEAGGRPTREFMGEVSQASAGQISAASQEMAANSEQAGKANGEIAQRRR